MESFDQLNDDFADQYGNLLFIWPNKLSNQSQHGYGHLSNFSYVDCYFSNRDLEFKNTDDKTPHANIRPYIYGSYGS
jgi:hypothetical protein